MTLKNNKSDENEGEGSNRVQHELFINSNMHPIMHYFILENSILLDKCQPTQLCFTVATFENYYFMEETYFTTNLLPSTASNFERFL